MYTTPPLGPCDRIHQVHVAGHVTRVSRNPHMCVRQLYREAGSNWTVQCTVGVKHRTSTHTHRTSTLSHRTSTHTHRTSTHTHRTSTHTHRTPTYTHRSSTHTHSSSVNPTLSSSGEMSNSKDHVAKAKGDCSFFSLYSSKDIHIFKHLLKR